MGIVNVTPDSFSDGGRYFDKDAAIRRALQMVRDGADIIDIGGESTRPGAKPVDTARELVRVIPVIRALAKKITVPISIDTRKSEVADAALAAGASIVNDISALYHDPHMAEVVARRRAYLILMHMQGTPESMQRKPHYKDVVRDIIKDLKCSVAYAMKSGITRDKIIIDPGIGFGKTYHHNIEILRRLDEFKALRLPICIGTSRKSFIGKALGVLNPADRLQGTVATSVFARIKGANILRVHDVKEVAQAILMTNKILAKGNVCCRQ